MKLLHVIASCSPRGGGPIEGIKQLYKYYKKNGVKTEILSADDPKETFLKDKLLPKVHALGKGYLKYRFNPKIKIWLNDNIKNYDCIIIDGLWQYHDYITWKVAKNKNVPYYIFTHGMLDPWFNKKYPLKYLKKIIYWHLIQYKILKDARKVLFTTIQEEKLAKTSFKPYTVKSKVVGYGTAGNPYLFSNKNIFLVKYKSLKNKKILLFLGRIAEKKGLEILINAFNKSKDLNMHLVLAGNDNNDYAKKIKILIKEKQMKSCVTWTGPLYGKMKWDAFRASSLFCLTSHQENFGVSVAEALSSGLPVLITDKVNIFQTIKKYKSGFVNSDSIKGTIKSINKWKKNYENKLEKQRIYKNCIRCFKENFQIKYVVKKIINIVHEN